MTELKSEEWYVWRTLDVPRDEDTKEATENKKRFLVPWSDPRRYEFSFDFIFETPEAAQKGLDTWGARDDAEEQHWVLVKMTLQEIIRL